MKQSKSLYRGHGFPAVVVSCAVRWYFRLQLSLRDVEELLFERGVIVTYETIRCWCDKYGADFSHRVKTARRKPGSTWHLDEMFVTLRGEPYLLWRAVDEHDAELDVSSSVCCARAPCRVRSPPINCEVIGPQRPKFQSFRRVDTCHRRSPADAARYSVLAWGESGCASRCAVVCVGWPLRFR
jgi:hypothetical protein